MTDKKFKTGESNKGRPPGAKNKVGSEVKKSLENFLKKKTTQTELDSIYQTLSPEDKATFIVRVSRFFISSAPTLTATINFDELTPEQMESILNNLNERQLDKLIERLKELRS